MRFYTILGIFILLSTSYAAECNKASSSIKIGDPVCVTFLFSGKMTDSSAISESYFMTIDMDQYTVTIPQLSEISKSFESIDEIFVKVQYLDYKGDLHVTSQIPIFYNNIFIPSSTVVFNYAKGKFQSVVVDAQQGNLCSKGDRESYQGFSYCKADFKSTDQPTFNLYIAFQGTDSERNSCQSVGDTMSRISWYGVNSLF